MSDAQLFAPHLDLAAQLLPHAFDKGDDGSHDVSHIARVWASAQAIQAQEGGNSRCLVAATLLHDCISLEKDAPNRADGSRLAGEKASRVLEGLAWEASDVAAVVHAIEAHSFSAKIEPESLEAKILQDADRLDAIGLIGVARCFYVAGRMGSGLYDPVDPEGRTRPLDDKAFALDHFETKLLSLAEGFQTATGATMAKARHTELLQFRERFLSQVGAPAR